MSLTKAVYSFAALAFLAGTLAAADNPWVGTWKLDLAKSVYTNHPKPKELTLTVTDEDATQTLAFDGTAADGSPIKMRLIAPLDGGQMTGFPANNAYDTAILKHLSPISNEIIYSKGGKEVRSATSDCQRTTKRLPPVIEGPALTDRKQSYRMMSGTSSDVPLAA